MGAATSSRPRLVRFGVFELDLRSGELRKSGARVSLQEQPLKLLECLLERPGEVVSREDLRERLWPGDTFVDFEQGVNAAVKRLREALSDSAEAPRFVQTLPRRGYRFVAPVTADAGPSLAVDVPAASSATPAAGAVRWDGWRRAAAVTGVAGVLIAAVGWVFLPRSPRPDRGPSLPAQRVTPLTTLSGAERQPTVSPDGQQVAFSWDGGASANADIYVTLIESSAVRRLTTDAGRDFWPQWSPDGRQIAYVRAVDAWSQRIRVMAALGGSDRELSDFPVWAPIAWSPDGRFIAAGRGGDVSQVGGAHAIHLIPVREGEPRQLTRPAAGSNDWSPRFSPNGRRLAYASCRGLVYRSNCHVDVVDLDANFSPVGAPRRLTPDSVWTLNGLTWTRDGAEVIYSARQGSLVHLWRVDSMATRPPERIELAGRDAQFPVVAPVGDRLAYTQEADDMDTYRVDPPGVAQPLARSSAVDSLPQLSPDGRRIAFCSARSNDAFEVWVGGVDGSLPERLTHGPGHWQCSPAWSPDGTRIAFDSQAPDGSWHVWTIGVNGGSARQITTEAGSQARPSWSRDGRWIYFLWERDQDRDVWRTRAPGGPMERVTRSGSSLGAARESIDGTGIWYKNTQGDGPLLFQALSGGAPRPVLSCVQGPSFAVGAAAIYYAPCRSAGAAGRDLPVRVFSPITGEDRLFTTLTDVLLPAAGRPLGQFVVSPNGRTLLFSRLNRLEADLMLIEHFR